MGSPERGGWEALEGEKWRMERRAAVRPIQKKGLDKRDVSFSRSMIGRGVEQSPRGPPTGHSTTLHVGPAGKGGGDQGERPAITCPGPLRSP